MVLAQAVPASLQPGEVLGFVLLDLVVILAVARLLGALANKVGQPRVVGEIVAGIVLGPTLLGRSVLAWDRPWSFLNCDASLAATGAAPSITDCLFPPQARSGLGLLGQIALVLFMFLVGLELDWSLLRGKARSVAAVAVGSVGVPVALGFVVGPLLYGSAFVGGFGTPDQPGRLAFNLFVAAMLSVTAFPVMARILQEKGLTSTLMGSIGVASAAVVTVLMFLTLAAAAGVASDQGPSDLVVKFVLTGAFIAGLFLVVRPALQPLGRAYEARGSLTPGLFAAVLVLVFICSYLAHQLGINVIVGSFLAGVVLPARTALFRDMAGRLADVTAVVLLPVFLAFSGLNTDFTTLRPSHVPGIALFLAAGVVGKWLGAAASARTGGLSWAEGNVLGILMNCRGLLILVVALIALDQGVISGPMQAGAVLMALVTTVMTGPLFDAFLPRAGPASPPAEGLPALAPARRRVVAGFDELDEAPALAAAAFALVGDPRPAEVVLCRLIPLPAHRHVVTGIADETLETRRSLRFLRGLAALAPAGVEVVSVASSSVDFTGDLAGIAAERECEAVVVPWRFTSSTAESDGLAAGVLAAESERTLSWAVVAVRPGPDGAPPRGPVAVVGQPLPGGVADKLAGHLAERAGGGLRHLPLDAEAAWEAGAARSSALVICLDGAGRPRDGDIDAALSRLPCPAFVVRQPPGRQPPGAGDRRPQSAGA